MEILERKGLGLAPPRGVVQGVGDAEYSVGMRGE